ncbi:ThuA domain-containing protein [Micromonospora yasonensis]|uniref:ThuA domain-containing protein n=1 Tax=Micromonospora yasonensis TaxID=1128667 RepID=UPI00222F5350|nr:ThuA domain-containing protein [Micromonospora yasonensis]MCW3839536.1 ThuA domain-containing protein [Micromonospora yasonensis]
MRRPLGRRLTAFAGVLALVGATLAGTASASAPAAAAPAPGSDGIQYRVLVFTKSTGGDPAATTAGVEAIRELGDQLRFSVQTTNDARKFDLAYLKKFRAVVFLNTSGDLLNADQQAAFESYYRAGGGFVGIGSAIEAQPGWQFLSDVLGTRASGRTDVQPGTIKVADRVHDASKNLPEYWTRSDAWYNFQSNVRGKSHVLATVVEDTFAQQPWGGTVTGITGGTMGADHPVTWCKDWQGGRSFYTALGNTAAGFGETNLRSHLGGAIKWAAGQADQVYSDCGATVLANYQQTAVALPPNTNEPIGFDVLPDSRVIQTDRRGGVRLHDPKSNTTTVLAQIPVYTASEDGLYGPGIDDNFATNHWVYLYYAPPTVKDVKLSTGEIVTQTTPAANAPNTGDSPAVWDPWVGYFQLSRFKFVDATADTPAHLDVASEQEIMRVPVNRGACCHVAGDIDFDKHGNLWLVTGDDTPAGGGNSGGFGPFNDQLTTSGQYNAPFVDARRSAQNTNDLRGKILRITVKGGDIASGEANHFGGAYTVPTGNLFPVGAEKTRPEIYAMGFRNPFRIQVDENDVAYITDYSPDSQTPQNFRGPAGTGRLEIVRKPANYGWPLCYKTDLPYYRWDFNTSTPLDNPAQTFECDNPTRGPQNNSRWNLNGGPSVEPGLEYGPPITNPDIWYSYTPENRATNPIGTPCLAYYNGSGATTCPRLFPELGTGGVGPQGSAKYHFDPNNADPTKLPPYYDNAVFFGEFTRDTLREVRLDSQNRIFKINDLLDCAGLNARRVPDTNKPFECDNPMDMQFDGKGHFYLLGYGDGFFNVNNDAGLYRWDYVKGQRAPIPVLAASPTNGSAPLTVQFSSAGSRDPDPSDSIRFEWDFTGDGVVDSTDPDPQFTYTTAGQYTARLTVLDSSGKSASANTTITVGNTAPKVTINTPVEGGTYAFGDSIPFSVTVTDPEDGTIDCSRVEVTFVLGHDTHGHAEQTVNGCTGVLPTDANDVSHGGNVFGVISASYTDLGGPGGVPALTTVSQTNVRQKLQEVEFAVEESGTNVATTNDPAGGSQHRGSLGSGDWIALNGPFNLTNINSLTFRVASTSTQVPAGGPMAAVEVHLDAVNGPILTTAALTSTGNTATWQSQTFPITDPGGLHKIYLVFRSVTGGQTGGNLFNLNWTEFGGQGVSGP